MNVDTRLIRLEDRIKPVGCATCRQWDGTVIGDDTGAWHLPERCPACGRRVSIRTMVHLVGVPLAEL